MSRQPLISEKSLTKVNRISPRLHTPETTSEISTDKFDINSYVTDHFTHEQREKAVAAGATDKRLGEMALAEAQAQFRVENGRLSPEEDPNNLLEGAKSDYDRRLAELAITDKVHFDKAA